MEKRGQILADNVIFIVLNLIFLAMLVFFVMSRTSSAATLEEKYSKQIALIIDAAKPGMKIHLNMEDAMEKAKSNGVTNEIAFVKGNTVTVKLRNEEKTGYSYTFFNNVDASIYLSENKKDYVITINSYK